MAGQADFINILREIRGSAAPGEQSTDGIWHELTAANKNGNYGIYGDILAKYGVITESAGTFDQAVAILENLNVDVTTLPAGAQATSALVNGVWQIGIPRGLAGTDGEDGFTPVVTINYVAGDLKYAITVDGVQITNTTLVNLDGLVDTRVNANVDVQTTLTAKQEVLDAVAVAQGIADGLDATVAGKIVELSNHTITKIGELNTASAAEQLEISTTADAEKLAYDQNATVKVTQYNDNHITKLAEYDANDELKIEQYNANHVERLENLDEKYATRIIDMLNTNKILGMVDRFAAISPTHHATFIDTVNGNYLYYLNGVLLPELVGYTVLNNTTIELLVALAYGDIVTQVDSTYVRDYLTANGVVLEERIGQSNGVAGLDGTGKVPAVQLPSYVDDVIEVAVYADLPSIGKSNKIYIVVADENSGGGDTSSYRWTGTVYAMVSNTLNASDVKVLYEANPDTNEYSDAEKVLVDVSQVLETTATTLPTAINEIHNELDAHKASTGEDHTYIDQDVTIAATPTFAGIVTEGLVDGRDVSEDGDKLDTIEENAKDDQTGAEIKALYEAELNTNAYTDAEKSRVAVSVLLQTTAQTLPDAINEIDSRLDDLNVSRADKALASKDVANLIYSAGNLVKIRYTTDDDVDYEVLTYVGEDLTNVAHYVDGVLQGNTVLAYASGELVSSIFVGV